ncbi:MAG: hypothetical protein KKH11_05535 [Candidatus Omnitrophica bacterium]|nr:hypothetical protein [Candidatus Omnitrophota bacterium]
MFRWIFNKKAQNTAEYAILIGLIVAAAVAMQTYVKRGLQGRLKDGVDELAEKTAQYEPYYLSSDFQTTSQAKRTATVGLGGGVGTETEEESARAGTQEILETE